MLNESNFNRHQPTFRATTTQLQCRNPSYSRSTHYFLFYPALLCTTTCFSSSPSSSVHTSSSPSSLRRRPAALPYRIWGNFGFKCCWAKCWRLLLLLRRQGDVHVCALMKGGGSVKGYGKGGSGSRLRGEAGGAKTVSPPGGAAGQRPAPSPPPPPGQQKK